MTLDELRDEIMADQKKGLPFMLAAILIWTMIAVVSYMSIPIQTKNTITFCCSCPLMPLAFLFGKMLNVNIFSKKNPLANLGFLFTLNQMLYLLIVMWVFNAKPSHMVMVYAMVFGAHLLPFSWLYRSKAYGIVSITETLAALMVGCLFDAVRVALVSVAIEVLLVISLFVELKEHNDKDGDDQT